MALNLGQIRATITANTQQFASAISQVQRQMSQLGNQLSSQFGGNLQQNMNSANRGVKQFGAGLKDMDRIVGGILISQMFYQAKEAIEQATVSMVGFMNNMEKSQIALTYFLGNEDKAKSFINTMKDFAATTAFSTEQALLFSRMLMNSGFKPEEIRQVLTLLNDASAVTGATEEQLYRIIYAFTQLKNNGKILGTELRQLAEAQLPIYDMLSEKLGMTKAQLMDIGELKIDSEVGIQAILQSLTRFNGAAAKVAQTLPGAWETIKDDAKFIGDTIFKAPYNNLKSFTLKWRDAMEDMRKVSMEKGTGGVFEYLIPPDMQDKVRTVVASMQSLWDSFKQSMKALAPSMKMVIGAFIELMAALGPPIAAVVKSIVWLQTALMQANPWVRMLAAAILGLVVAQAASKALLFLWTVTRMGTICTAVARAVEVLALAIRGLYIAAAANPVVGVILLIAGALLYLAMSTETVSRWMSKLTGQLASLSGINIDDVLQPKEGTKWIDEYNKSLEFMNKDLTQTGKSAEKAGKKVKDKFVASFDELYQIPDTLDQANDAIKDMDKLVGGMPDFNIPKVDPTKAGGGGGPDWGSLVVPPAIRNNKPGDGGDKGDGNGPTPPDPGLIMTWEAKLNEAIARLRAQLEGAGGAATAWANSVQTAVQNAFTPIEPAIVTVRSLGTGFQSVGEMVFETVLGIGKSVLEMTGNMAINIGTFVADSAKDFGGWVAGNSQLFAGWVVDNAKLFSGWVTDNSKLFAGWVVGNTERFADFVGSSSKAFGGFVADNAKAFANFAADSGKSIADFALGGIETVGNFVADTGAAFGTWVTDRIAETGRWSADQIATFGTWATTTGTKVTTWVSDRAADFGNWAVRIKSIVDAWNQNFTDTVKNWANNTGANIASWVDTGIENFSLFARNVGSTMSSWATSISSGFYNVLTNIGNNIAGWANNGMDSFGVFARNTSQTVSSWISTISSGFASWANNVGANFAAFGNSAGSIIDSWAANTWDTMNSLFRGTASGAYSWAKNILGTIVGWAKSAWDTISGIAKAVGSSIGVWSGEAADNMQAAWSGMGSWVSDHKQELKIGAVVTGILGAGVATVLTGGAAAPALAAALVAAPVTLGGSDSGAAKVKQYATGGIVSQDQIARIAEGNKKEAIIPLENSSYMAPFSAAVANDLVDMLAPALGGSGGQQSHDDRPILYVGTLIADDRSLKELERKLQIVRVSESQRREG